MRLVDADALMERVKQEEIQAQAHGREFSTSFYNGGGTVSTEWWFVEDLIDNAPTIEPERKAGCWVGIDDEPHDEWECDRCGFIYDGSPPPNFCENCGADMRQEEERDES